jgi:hypothetical protein
MANNMFRRLLLPLVLTTALGGLAGRLFAASDALGGGSESDGALQIHASFTIATKDRPAQLSITAEIPDGWHIFSITQQPGGPNPTRIKLIRRRTSKTIRRCLMCRWKSISAP